MKNNNETGFSEARQYALSVLDRRMITEYKLKEKLLKKGFSKDVSDEVLSYLKENRFIDDADYAVRYAKDALSFKGHGARRIKTDLRLLGVDDEFIEEALSELDFGESIERVFLKKTNGVVPKEPKEKKKLFDFFLRRGYSFYEINELFSKYTEECYFD